MDKIEIKNLTIDKKVLTKVSEDIAKKHNIMPVSFENNLLTIALSDPNNITILDELRFVLGCEIKAVLAEKNDISEAIKKYYRKGQEPVEGILGDIEKGISAVTLNQSIKGKGENKDQLQELAAQAPVVKLLDKVLLEAVEKKASDLHFEPFGEHFYIRYRIDGVLYDIVTPPKSLALAITSRIKVLSNLDVAESRLPQDGRVLLEIKGKKIDFRVSTLPTVFGESVVMRVLDRNAINLSIETLGFSERTREQLESLINKPNGIVLTTGPTGSGKTTTLYSCLGKINTEDKKIITTEDPVEYDVPGIIQVSIKPKIELTFAVCLRSILRQDPDVIMVGEIRDEETAQMAIQAALTGHLVFSTLHTNDAPSAITRLIDMGVEPFLLTSTIRGLLAQRLVRKICKNCKKDYIPSVDELKELDLTQADIQGKKIYKGMGCDKCNNTGYKGRIGIYELFVLNEQLHYLVLEKAQSSLLREKAVELGMKTLRDDGLLKIFAGVTTISEVARETK